MTETRPRHTLELSLPSDHTLVLKRRFDAPRALVWQALTDPRHLAQWWGPIGYENPICECDLRVGGAWRIVQRAPDGSQHPFKGVFLEIVPPERLVQTWAYDVEPYAQQPTTLTVTLEERDGGTELTSTTVFDSAEARDGMLQAGAARGAAESYDRLEALLPTIASSTETADREVVLTRVFDAPRELVFDVWTDARHLAQWFGPDGFRTTTHGLDVRPGGVWRFVMHGPGGVDYPNRFDFLEVVRPERLVYQHSADGATSGDDDWTQFEVTVTFVEAAAGTTRLTLRQLYRSAAAREYVARAFGAVEGGNQTLRRLAAYLAQL